MPAPVGASNLLLARSHGCWQGVTAAPRHPTGCSRGSIPQQPPGGAPHPQQFWCPVPVGNARSNAGERWSSQPCIYSPKSSGVRGVSSSCQGAAAGGESMSAGRIWGKATPPHTKGRLHTGLSGTAHPVGPRAPPIKCFLAPSPVAQTIEGGVWGEGEPPTRSAAGSSTSVPNPGVHREPPDPKALPGARWLSMGVVSPAVHPRGPTAPTGVGGSCPHSGSAPSAQGPGGGGGQSLLPLPVC